MTITFNEVNNILKTLPIGYYVGRKVNVQLNNSASTSYYIPIEDRIEISFRQISSALSKVSDDSELETLIRSLLYHEVSHAFLTPSKLKPTRNINIFEDERIETLLKSYYMNTDFKRLVKLINDDTSIKSADDLFYNVVRFRHGPKEFTDRVQDLIKKHSKLTRTSGSSWRNYELLIQYQADINRLYEDIKAYFFKHFESIADDTSNTSSNNEELEKSIMKHGSGESDGEDSDFELNNEEIEKVFSNPLNTSEFGTKVKTILQKIKTFESRNGSAIHAYSGVFNPRSVARDDYRFFLQENRLGSAKAFSKIHLNLFIDNSGSFEASDFTVNCLLKALRDFEKSNQNFSFDLVTINTEIEVKKHDNLHFQSYGGNRVKDEIHSIYNSLQRQNAKNFNIVLFDGDAVSDSYGSKMSDAANFKAFDHSNTFIITDSANEWILAKHIRKAKTKIISGGYAKELQNEILRILQAMT